MNKFIISLILVLFSASVFSQAVAAPATMTEDQIRRIAEIALEQQAVAANQKNHPSLPEKSEATREEVTKWADLLSGIVVTTAQKVGVAVNEFVKTPVGFVVTGLIVYKAIGDEIIQLIFGFGLWIFTCAVSVILLQNRPRNIRTNVTYTNVPVLFGLWNRKVAQSYNLKETGDVVNIFIACVVFLVGTAVSAIIAC